MLKCKQFFAAVISLVILCSCLCISAAAAYDISQRNLFYPYTISGNNYELKYAIKPANATTEVQITSSGKAYVGLQQRNNSTGANAGYVNDPSTYNDPKNYYYITAYISGGTYYANYVQHSGYKGNSIIQTWRFDLQYNHVG